MDGNLFVFDLNESLYLETGQEISEMLSISLDPEITVQPFNDYVSIRGVIQLQGEYQKAEVTEERDIPLELEDYHSRRYLERVEETAEGVASFSHEFPIEISVPTDRVADVNNIMVDVEWFDYDLPTENQLKLTSRIAIEGISQQREKQENDESLAESVDLIESENERFEFEILEEKEQEESVEERQEDEVPVINESVSSKSDAENEEENDKNRWPKTKSQSLAEFFNTSPSSPLEPSAKMESEGTYESVDHVDSNEYIEELMESRESAEVELSESSSEDMENVTYLADMFRESEEDVEFTKVRICIVQENDTLEAIADRYEIPKLQLLKQNRLDGDDLSEGQLLSIPVRNRKQS